MSPLRTAIWIAIFLALAPLCHGQGGPPLLTDDPGTPGNHNWEINTAVTVERGDDEHLLEVPALDFNYGWGSRIQLKYQVSWIRRSAEGQDVSGWSNSLAGVKWRFLENKKHDFQISTYPQIEWSIHSSELRDDLKESGTSFLLPLEIAKKVGPVDINVEGGRWFSDEHASWITGVAVGHQQTERLELLGEWYRVTGVARGETETLFDVGSRYRLAGPIVLILSAGRSFSGPRSGEPQFIGYFGIQWLLPVSHRQQ